MFNSWEIFAAKQTDIESKGALEIMKVPMKLNFQKGCLSL